MPRSLLTSLFAHKAACNRGLVGALRAAPAETDRARMAVALLTLEHTHIVDRLFQSRLNGAEPPFAAIASTQVPELETLAASLAETDAWYEAYAAEVSDAELETVVEFTYVADGDTGRLTKGQILAHLITHGAAHRAGINTSLKGLGVVPAFDQMITTFHAGR